MKKRILYITSIISILVNNAAWAQPDSTAPLVITYEQAQEIVIQKNLQLVAAHYDIQIAEAQLKQARLWRNPLFVWNADLYSIEQNKYMNAANQRLIQIEQVISISGKHRNEVRLARIGVEMSKTSVNDVMRGLLYECAIQYTNLQTLQEQEKLYEITLKQFEEVLRFAEDQLQKGNMAGNEVTRLKTELLDLKTQQQGIYSAIEEASGQLRILMAIPDNVPIQTVPRTRPVAENVSLPTITNLAKELRPDYKLRKQAIAYEEQNLKLQKSMAIPDFNFGYQPHDKGSNYVRPYSGIVLEFSVPLFDRNQGGIQEAQARIKQAQANMRTLDQQLEQEIATSYNQFLIQQEGLNRYDNNFLQELETFNSSSISSYNKRLITLLEFIDQQRIYIQTKNQQLELFNGYMQALNDLNFRVGGTILE